MNHYCHCCPYCQCRRCLRASINRRALENKTMTQQSHIQYENIVDRQMFGFPKRKIIYDIQYFIDVVARTVGRENKIHIARDLFSYLAMTDCKKFIQHHATFNNVVKEKLIEFRYKENLREAQRWWRDIFGTRIPIES